MSGWPGGTARDRRRAGRDVRVQRRLVEAWTHPSGTPVDVRLASGEIRRTRTSSGADLLGGHTAVIWLDGIAGCYDLARVTPVREGT